MGVSSPLWAVLPGKGGPALYKKIAKGCRDSSGIKSADSSSRGPEFSYQHPHGGAQLSVTPIQVNLAPLHRKCIQINKVFKRGRN